jgi:hypothetical protein
MQVVQHKQAQPTMPEQSLMVEFHRREHGIASAGPAQLVLARRHAVDRDEKPTAFGHPLRNCVRQLFADGQTDVADPSADVRTRANAKRQGAQSSARGFRCNSHSGVHGVTRATNAQSLAEQIKATSRSHGFPVRPA